MTSASTPRLISSDASSGSGGKLSATILSVYDIPSSSSSEQQEELVPSYVSMSILGREVKTGKPSAKHKVMNNYKFVSNNNDTSNGNGSASTTNVLSLSAPLSVLYPTTVTFRVVFDSSETLMAKVQLSSKLQINQQQWLIVNLYPESQSSSSPSSSATKGQDTNVPTLRLKLCLSGPYRTEIGAIVSLAQSWFQIIDSCSIATNTTIKSLSSSFPLKFPSPKLLLVPTVPLATAAVALLPIVFGLLILGLPFLLPIIVFLLTIGTGTFLLGSGVYFSSSMGRESACTILGPIYSTFLSTESGQKLIYQTGPRPSPPALMRSVLPNDIIGKLVVSLLIDFIGSCSYLLPIVGEGFDIAWAPIQTIFIMAMYDDTMPGLKYVSFIEEILPFTDLLPSGTLGWVREFSPLMMEEGLKKVADMRVVMRGERQTMRQGVRT